MTLSCRALICFVALEFGGCAFDNTSGLFASLALAARCSLIFEVSQIFESVFAMSIADQKLTAAFGYGFLFASYFSIVSAACQNELEGGG